VTEPAKPADDVAAGAFRCGAIAVVGRPNVGKSTLVNTLVGERLSITSRKPQTTRHRIRGILTTADAQYIFVDTPGFQSRHRSALNRLMNRGVRQALEEVDVALLVIEAGRFDAEDRDILAKIPKGMTTVLAVNKIDKIERPALLEFLQKVGAEASFSDIVPMSAARRKNTVEVLKALRTHLQEGPPVYAEDEFTDRNERFLAAERVREKLFRLLGEEVPYGATVIIDKFEHEGRLRRIFATIVVDKDSHKAMVIGAKGAKLKEIGSEARKELETLFGGKIYLELWVKVRSGWTDDESQITRLGYE
jgi:GTP-binding protein Era